MDITRSVNSRARSRAPTEPGFRQILIPLIGLFAPTRRSNAHGVCSWKNSMCSTDWKVYENVRETERNRDREGRGRKKTRSKREKKNRPSCVPYRSFARSLVYAEIRRKFLPIKCGPFETRPSVPDCGPLLPERRRRCVTSVSENFSRFLNRTGRIIYERKTLLTADHSSFLIRQRTIRRTFLNTL